MAGCTKLARCIGIEIQSIPAEYSKKMQKYFETLMNWYGKKYTPFDLYEGSFTEPSSNWVNVKNGKKDLIDRNAFDWKKDANVIFINNFAFSANLNLQVSSLDLSSLLQDWL